MAPVAGSPAEEQLGELALAIDLLVQDADDEDNDLDDDADGGKDEDDEEEEEDEDDYLPAGWSD